MLWSPFVRATPCFVLRLLLQAKPDTQNKKQQKELAVERVAILAVAVSLCG
jgi:hypothetical protein